MKTATIITFSKAKNFGAALQCYGIYKAISDLGVNTELLNYNPKYLSSQYSILSTRSLKHFVKSFLFLPIGLSRAINFNSFNKLMKYTHSYSLNSDIELNTDYLILGSDQIWNSTITGGYDPVFWGNIGNKKKSSLISYAASFGNSNLNKEDKSILLKEIQNIEHLSVREREAQNVIFETTGIFPELTLDPSFLLKKNEWLDLIKHKKTRKNKKFLLLYSLCQYPETIQIAKLIAKKKDLKLIEINANLPSYKNLPKHLTKYGLGPFEFLQLFRDAAFVVTDSFHGTAFSIIMEKDFYSIPHKEKGERMTTLINLTRLNNRLITRLEQVNLNEHVDYVIPRKEIAKNREKSLFFIKKAINYNE